MKFYFIFTFLFVFADFNFPAHAQTHDHSHGQKPPQSHQPAKAQFKTTLKTHPKVVRYDLKITNQKVNITGQDVDFALMVNGGIPAPTLEFTEGDFAEITVTNLLSKEETSIHWHGILLPHEEDGVPYVNTPPILPGKSRTFKFPIRQHGTYWYHSHTMLQEQKGVYGAIIIHPQQKRIKVDHEAVVVLSDWSNENGDQILKNLKKDGDYYLHKKNSIRSIFGATQAGQLKTYFGNEWIRMGGMDLSDVGYDAFLLNGQKDSQLVMAHPGQRVRIRIINAASSTYFYVRLGQTAMQVIAADGIDVTPVMTNELLMGMAETYDVLFTVPDHKNYELRATAQDVTGSASAWIGMGEKVFTPTKSKPDLYAPMNHGAHHEGHASVAAAPVASSHPHDSHDAHQNHAASSHHAHHSQSEDTTQAAVVEQLAVDDLKALTKTTLPSHARTYNLRLVLDGDMERYVWHINGKAVFEDRLLHINEGDVIRYTFVNKTMMHHPMHLHGHFFRVLNSQQDFSPLKHTVDVPPMGERTIEYYANEPGQWMLHCHNLYHMMTGMARVVRYNTFRPTPEQAHLDHQDHHLHDPWYFAGNVEGFSNLVEARFRISQTWNEISLRGETRKDDEWRGAGDLLYRRWLDNYSSLALGATAVADDYRGVLGFSYKLPLLIESTLLVDHKGKLRVDLEKHFQWTSTVFTEAAYTWHQDSKLESETALSLMYSPNWHWSAGLKYTPHSWGLGLHTAWVPGPVCERGPDLRTQRAIKSHQIRQN